MLASTDEVSTGDLRDGSGNPEGHPKILIAKVPRPSIFNFLNEILVLSKKQTINPVEIGSKSKKYRRYTPVTGPFP